MQIDRPFTLIWLFMNADNLNVTPLFFSDFNNSQVCSAGKEYVLSSSSSGEGSLDITCGDVIHRLRLPIGTYKYDKIQEDYNCSTTVKVKGR